MVNSSNGRVVEPKESDFSVGLHDGTLKFEFTGNQLNKFAYLIFSPLVAGDVKIETSAENLGRNNNNVSLICRYSEDGWYEFNIANNGLYWIYRYITANREYRLLASGGSTAIRWATISMSTRLSVRVRSSRSTSTEIW